VSKADVLMLQIVASRESNTRKLNPNEAAQIVVVEIQLRFDDDSLIAVWIDRRNEHNFICQSLLSKIFNRSKFGMIQTMQFSMMKLTQIVSDDVNLYDEHLFA
jgi:hypothetical protein